MYFLGLDGGGTKTNAILSDISGVQLRRTEGGPGNVSTMGSDSVKELILDLLEKLLEGEPLSQIQNATLCFAGIGREHSILLLQVRYLMQWSQKDTEEKHSPTTPLLSYSDRR